MRISDWSSDVCSSDLSGRGGLARLGAGTVLHCYSVLGCAHVGCGGFGRSRLVSVHRGRRLTGVGGHVGGLVTVVGGRVHAVGGRVAVVDEQAAHDVTEAGSRSEEHTSELQSLMRIQYAVLRLQKKTNE